MIIKPRVGTFVADYRRDGTMDTLMSIMNYNGGILREAEVRSILELRIALDSLAIQLWLPEAKDEEIHLLRSYVEALKTAKTTSERQRICFSFSA